MWMDPVSIRLVRAQLLKASGFICITLHKTFHAEGSLVVHVSYLIMLLLFCWKVERKKRS